MNMKPVVSRSIVSAALLALLSLPGWAAEEVVKAQPAPP